MSDGGPAINHPTFWRVADMGGSYQITDADGNNVPVLNDRAVAERVCACVNALAGVEDPEAFLVAYAGMLGTLRGVLAALLMNGGWPHDRKKVQRLIAAELRRIGR